MAAPPAAPAATVPVAKEPDVLTQLQSEMDQMAELFFTSLGVLQREAPRVAPGYSLSDVPNIDGTMGLLQGYVAQMVALSKTIDQRIDNLPGVNHSEAQQLQRLQELEQLNQEAGRDMMTAIGQAENMAERVRDALKIVVERRADVAEPMEE